MSTLNVDNLKTLSGNGIDADIVSIGGGQLSNRNKVINGAMRVSQRATSVTDASAGYHTVDRMRMSKNSISTAEMTHEQSTDSPNGFSKSVKITTTTAEGTVEAADAFRPVQYKLEGQDLQDLAYGTSDAKTLTLSFHVKSSVTGTYSVAFRNITAGTYRLRSTTYTIDSANTWEKKTITIAGDTSTAFIDDDSNRLEIYWCGGSGTDFTSSNVAASGWADYVSGGLHYGQTAQLQNTLNSTFLMTGIQLEVGDTATSFEHRSFGDELARCQRYCYVTPYGGSSTAAAADEEHIQGTNAFNYSESGGVYTILIMVTFPQPMRSTPTYTGSSTNAKFRSSNTSNNFQLSGMSAFQNKTTKNCLSMALSTNIGAPASMAGSSSGFLEFNAAGGYLKFESEP